MWFLFYLDIIPGRYGNRFSPTSLDIERVHNQFCMYVLRLPVYATNVFVHSELVRYKIEVFKNLKAIEYWLKLLTLPDDRIPKLCYKIQRRWVTNDTNFWFYIRNLLFHPVSANFG